jgi:RNA polymerase sigma-70 factor, ECF subfamily
VFERSAINSMVELDGLLSRHYSADMNGHFSAYALAVYVIAQRGRFHLFHTALVSKGKRGWGLMSSEDATVLSEVAIGRSHVDERQYATPVSSSRPLSEVSAAELAGQKPDDEALLKEIRNGSKDALGALFRRHRGAVLGVAWRILRDASEAEDLCQEVFLFLFERAKLFDPEKGSGSSWIIQIAYHRAMNRRKYLAFRQHYDAQELNEELIEGSKRPSLIEGIDAERLLSRLREQLSPEQRQTLELHFFEGYTLREIAAKLEDSYGNVRHYYYRGLERLRACVMSQKEL